MKKSYISLGLALAAISFASCVKVELAENNNDDQKVGQTFEIVANSATTKTANDGLDTKWVADDAITVFHTESGSTSYGSNDKFSIAESDLENGLFKGTLTEVLESGKSYDWYALYPYESNIITPANPSKGWMYIGSSSKSTAQVQTGNDSKAHLAGQYFPLYGKATNVAYGTTPSITLNQALAVVKVHVTNNTGANLTVSSVKFTANEDIVGSYYIDFAGEVPSFTSSGSDFVSNTATLKVTDGTAIANGASADFYIGIKPFTAEANTTLKVTVNEYEKDVTIGSSDVEFQPGVIKKLSFNYAYDLAIENGDYAIIAKDGDNYYAISANANMESERRDRVLVYYNGGELFETAKEDLVWTFNVSGSTYTIANGTNYMAAAKNTIPLKNVSGATPVVIAPNANGTYTLTADCGADGTRYMAMNGTGGFGWYASSTGTHNLYLVPATVVEPTYYNISVKDLSHGSVSVSKSQAEAGEEITLTVIPDDGYQLSTLTYNDIDITTTQSFIMPTNDVEIEAIFEAIPSGLGLTLFKEGFGDNSGSARAWSDTYKEQSGINRVYSDASYSMTNVKQGKNTTGSIKSGLNQTTFGNDAIFEVGPLNVSGYSNLILSYKWKAASLKESYSTSVYYKTSIDGTYIEIPNTAVGATTFVDVSVNIPSSVNSTLFLKIVFNTSNSQAIIDEVELKGDTK